MAYARWGDSCWYAYWSWKDIPPENKDEEELYIHYDLSGYGRYTYKELKEDGEDILFTIGIEAGATEDEVGELACIVQKFIADVDEEWQKDVKRD